jgi:hypothetical protein
MAVGLPATLVRQDTKAGYKGSQPFFTTEGTETHRGKFRRGLSRFAFLGEDFIESVG